MESCVCCIHSDVHIRRDNRDSGNGHITSAEMKLEILTVWFVPRRGDKQMQSRRWGFVVEGVEKLERVRSLMDSKAKKLGGRVHFLYRERPDLSAENAD